MFKSKARKQAEYQIKVEREKQKLLEKQQRQQEQAQAVINATKSLLATGKVSDEYTAIDIAISSAAGLVTGGPLGLFLSPVALKMWESFGLRQRGKWIAWGLTGVIAGPVCWSFVIGGDSHRQTTEVAKTDTSIVQNRPAPKAEKPSETPKSKPSVSEPMDEDFEIVPGTPAWKKAGSDACWDTVSKAWGFDSPKGSVVGTYKAMGYQDSQLDNMYDLTKVAAYRLFETNRNTGAVISSMTNDWLDGNQTAAEIVVGVANQIYLPKHLEIAGKKCL